jgi:hypothetical protein
VQSTENDDKATPSEATRAYLDVLVARLREVVDTAVRDSATAANNMNVSRADDALSDADQAEAEAVRDLITAALAAERDRADRAEESLEQANITIRVLMGGKR